MDFLRSRAANSHVSPDAGSGTALAAVWNLLLFQMLKSEPSTTPSALKSPRHQRTVAVNLLAFQMPKSLPSTTPSKLASPRR